MNEDEAKEIAQWILTEDPEVTAEALHDTTTDHWLVVAGPIPAEFKLTDEQIHAYAEETARSSLAVHVVHEERGTRTFILVTAMPKTI